MKDKSLLHTILLIILILVAGIALFWLVVVRVLAKLGGGDPCPYALAWLVDNPIRRCYMGSVLDRVGIRPGEQVLELGPGPGAFTVKAARRTEPDGTLVAVDIQPKMIAAVERKVREADLTNVETHVASAYELPLEDESVDRALLVTVLPEIPDRQRALVELRRVLKPDRRSSRQIVTGATVTPSRASWSLTHCGPHVGHANATASTRRSVCTPTGDGRPRRAWCRFGCTPSGPYCTSRCRSR